jgi:hypothetical protein
MAMAERMPEEGQRLFAALVDPLPPLFALLPLVVSPVLPIPTLVDEPDGPLPVEEDARVTIVLAEDEALRPAEQRMSM